MSRLTYGHFYQTGIQDCSNVFSWSDFDPRPGMTAEEIVTEAMLDWDDQKQEWIDQLEPEDYEGLDPDRCHASWKAGWRAQAIVIVTMGLAKDGRIGRLRED